MGSILGALSTLAGEAASRLLVLMGIGRYDIYQLDSIIITVNRPSVPYGLVINFIAGGVTAFLLIMVLDRFGKTFIVYKGAALATLAWFAVECFATAFFEGKFIDIRPLDDYAVHFIGALVTGLALGLLMKWTLYSVRESMKT